MTDALSNIHSHRILVVDDHPVNQMVLTAMLAELDFSSDTAISGIEAVRMADRCDYDLIFMDIQMPGMDGYETTEQIRKIPAHSTTPVIAMTASTIDNQLIKRCESNMNQLIGKPYEHDTLKKLLTHWLELSSEPVLPVRLNQPLKQTAEPATGEFSCLDSAALDQLRDTFAGTDKASLIELIEVFLETLTKLHLQLKQNILDRDIQAVRQTAHALKSCSGNIAALRYMSISSDIEQIAISTGSAQIDAITKPWTELENEYDKLLPELKQLISLLQSEPP